MDNLSVLVIGSGGREHAIVKGLAADETVAEIHCAPGNPGIGALAKLHSVKPTEVSEVVALAKSLAVDLVVIGPEAPLVAGVADGLRQAGIACFGPSKAAAQIESSKAFAKEIMNAAQVPTARSYVCRTAAEAEAALNEFGAPYVVKDDGLAAGKGVVVTRDRDAAFDHAMGCEQVVIEEYLDGEEVSLFVVSDGGNALALAAAQDFKRIGSGGTGPNTGGMGAYSPLPWLPEGFVDEVMANIVKPTLAELADRGTPFVGLLYAGLALTSQGPKVVEFNARFGDPETQVVLSRLQSPLGQLLYAAATGNLGSDTQLRWSDQAAVCVVMAAPGYPGVVTGGAALNIPAEADFIHAGTALVDGQLVSAGGRVLGVLGHGQTVAQARRQAYANVDRVVFPDAQVRDDIAAGI